MEQSKSVKNNLKPITEDVSRLTVCKHAYYSGCTHPSYSSLSPKPLPAAWLSLILSF